MLSGHETDDTPSGHDFLEMGKVFARRAKREDADGKTQSSILNWKTAVLAGGAAALAALQLQIGSGTY